MAEFDPELARHLREDVGDKAEATAERAYAELRALADAWGVEVEGWLPGGTCSVVLTGWRGGEEVVLRLLALPWQRAQSLRTLGALSGHGGVPVLASDEATGAVLMPRLRPGTTLAEESEEAAVEALVGLVRRLRHAQGEAEELEGYVALLDRPSTLRLREGLPDDARRLGRRLLETSPPPVLLHGDLHHFNVLRHGEDWIAIDPEGVMGDPAYEFAAFMRNPVPEVAGWADLKEVLYRRVLRFAEALGDPPGRVWGWAFVRTALCVWTGITAFYEPWLRITQALDALAGEFDPL